MQVLAQRLLAVEAASESTSVPATHEAVRVCEKLRISLTRFAGADGFKSLLQRALVLASAEVPALKQFQVSAEGSLEGVEAVAQELPQGGGEAAAAVTRHLLGLLVTFVGKPITLKLVRDAWPEADLEE